MSEVATLEQPATETAQNESTTEQQVQPSVSELMAQSLWNLDTTPYKNPQQEQQAQPTTTSTEQTTEAQTTTEAQATTTTATTTETPAVTEDDVVGLDDYFTREFGMKANEVKNKWQELNKPSQPQEIKWSYDDSKEEEIYNYIQQKRQLDRLEKMDVADATQAAEIIKTNLQLKYKELKPEEIDRMFVRQYSIPPEPKQGIDQSDEEYAASMKTWRDQVNEKQQDMIIDAKLAKRELPTFKSQIVQPDIPKIQNPQQQEIDQKVLEALESGRQSYLSALEAGYQNFKGYSVMAKDGDVQLPISYSISPEELTASKKELENFDINGFFDKRWFGGENPNITQIQEDLYLLMNRDKIFQAIANQSATARYAHHIKAQNNINLNGVNKTLAPAPTTNDQRDQSQRQNQALAEKIWGL